MNEQSVRNPDYLESMFRSLDYTIRHFDNLRPAETKGNFDHIINSLRTGANTLLELLEINNKKPDAKDPRKKYDVEGLYSGVALDIEALRTYLSLLSTFPQYRMKELTNRDGYFPDFLEKSSRLQIKHAAEHFANLESKE